LLAAAPAADLDRHRPQLRYDAQESVFASAVDGSRHRAAPGVPPRVYGHVARERGETWLQYWIFYPSNPQDRGILRTGRHEGDWELVQVRVDDGGRAREATFAQHTWAEGCGWSGVRREGGAPVVFVANGSHASYSRPGTHDRFFPDPNDEADGRGRRQRPAAERITDGAPAWVAWPGRWGRTRARLVPSEASSPRGPRYQANDAWRRPASYADDAVACGAGPPWRAWQTGLVAGVALCAAAALFAIRRRYLRR
jgi:hypothetical protein